MLGEITPEAQVGLWLNMDRSSIRHSLEVLVAIRGAMSQGKLDKVWFEAISETPEEAEAMHNLHAAEVEMQGEWDP